MDELIVKLLEQSPTIAVLVWLVWGLRQDVRSLTATIIELKVHVAQSVERK
jgi:hypothetical protein